MKAWASMMATEGSMGLVVVPGDGGGACPLVMCLVVVVPVLW